jgi:hypothetical protein
MLLMHVLLSNLNMAYRFKNGFIELHKSFFMWHTCTKILGPPLLDRGLNPCKF